MASKSRLIVLAEKRKAHEVCRHLLNGDKTWSVQPTHTLDEMGEAILMHSCDLIVADLAHLAEDAAAAVTMVAERTLGQPIIALLADASHAASAVRAGAIDAVPDHPAVWSILDRVAKALLSRKEHGESSLRLAKSQRDAEQLLSSVISLVDQPLALVRPSRNIIIGNPALASTLDTGLGDIIGRPIDELIRRTDGAGLALPTTAHSSNESTRQDCMAIGNGLPLVVEARPVRLRGSSGAIAIKIRPVEEAGSSSAVRAAIDEAGQINDRLRQIAASASQATAGQIQLIGLDEVRAKYGKRWDEVAERINKVCEGVIRKALREVDVWQRMPDGSYLLCLVGATEDVARFRASEISRRINERLLGIAAAGDNLPAAERLANLDTRVHVVEIDPGELAAAESPVDLLRSKLAAKAEADDIDDCDTVEKALARLSLDIFSLSRPDFTPTQLVRLLPVRSFEEKLRQLGGLSVPQAQLNAQVDVRQVKLALDLFDSGRLAASQPAVVDIHFATLKHVTNLSALLDALHAAGSKAAQRLILNVVGVPDDIYAVRLSRSLARMQPFVRAVSLGANWALMQHLELAHVGTRLVCVDETVLRRLDEDDADARQIKIHLRQAHIRLIVELARDSLISDHALKDLPVELIYER